MRHRPSAGPASAIGKPAPLPSCFFACGVWVRALWRECSAGLGDGTYEEWYDSAVRISAAEAVVWCYDQSIDPPKELENLPPGPQQPQSKFLDADKAAEHLGISRKALYGRVQRGGLVPLTGYKFTREQLDEYMKGETDGQKSRIQRPDRRRPLR